MDIFIKSFNRPYYLDRCIESIVRNIYNGDYSIIILDDGTQQKYLDKIKNKYKNISILKSEYYDSKVQKINDFIEQGTEINNMVIPAAFWKKSIKSSKENYILVLEDDFWITQRIDLTETIEIMKQYKMPFMKLFYFNNHRFLCGKIKNVNNKVSSLKPEFKISSPFIVKNVILKNKFRSFSVLQRLGIVNYNIKFDYYTLYSVAGAIYTKQYYDVLWENSHDVVNEELQLCNAYDNYYKNKKTSLIGFFSTDVVNTSFSSSATNMFSHINLNVYQYNHELNESWYNEKFDPMQGYPRDIYDTEILKVLNDSKIVKIEEWKKWKSFFLKQYTDIGISNE